MPISSSATGPEGAAHGSGAAARPGPRRRAAEWLAGVVLGVVVLGPGLGSGPLLSLDLLLTPRVPFPPGLWGLGPALPQRVPSFVPIAVLSPLVGGPTAGKLFVVVAVAVAFVGGARLVGRAPMVAGTAAGLLFAGGPFLVTRVGAGHLNVLWAAAALPWALPHLLHPSEDLRRTFLAAVAIACAGSAGGSLLAIVVVVGLVTEAGPRRVARAVATVAAANLVWFAPDVVVLWAGAEVHGGNAFHTNVPDVTAAFGLLSGGGFWRSDTQVGARGVVAAAASAALLGLAVLGHRDLPERFRRGALGLGVVGMALAVASAVPGVRTAYGALTDLPLGAPLRESGRMLVLWLAWAAPAAALGGRRLAEAVAARWRASAVGGGVAGLAVALPLVIALVLAAPGLVGAQGRLRPTHFPHGWSRVRTIVRARPGTVLAFPWHEYVTLSFAGGRSVLNPLPDYLGGDVLSSYDPEFDAHRSQEQVDHRARVVDDLMGRVLAERAVGTRLRRLGVRWVVLAHEADWARYVGLYDDAGLRLVLQDRSIDLFAVRGWSGPVRSPSGATSPIHRPLPPVLRTSAPPGSVLDLAGAPGWVRGWGHAARTTADGRLVVPDGTGVLWFWPSVPLLLVDLATLGAVVGAARSLRRRPAASWPNDPGSAPGPGSG